MSRLQRAALSLAALTLSALRGASSQTETAPIFLSKFDALISNYRAYGSRSERRDSSERSGSSSSSRPAARPPT